MEAANNCDAELESILRDFPPGPLDNYRKQSTFRWQDMCLLLEGSEALVFKHSIWQTLSKEPLFNQLIGRLPLAETRLLALKRAKYIAESRFFTFRDFMIKPHLLESFVSTMGSVDWSSMVKYQLLYNFAISTIFGLGTERHHADMQKLIDQQIGACFCLTEIAHGTNTKAMRTTATYNVPRAGYVLHTPDFEAAKCWSGNLGETATHAIVFAQLHTPDGECHGLHAFWIQIRDMDTLQNLPGVSIGDMGEKIGLNGIDNGVMMFDNFLVPSSSLLNRTGDVDPDGHYISPIKDKKKRLGASLGNLSAGRVGIVGMAKCNLVKAVTIAVRYSAVRRQFGPQESGPELPVIEYQLQQWRLLPHVAGAYVLVHFAKAVRADFVDMQKAQLMKTHAADHLAAVGAEMHAISSCAKPLASWLARDAIQECREACGGHGYLAAAGFGILRDDNDANCTYEGDNNVLLQQSANWLLQLWLQLEQGQQSITQATPLRSASFLDRHEQILASQCHQPSTEIFLQPERVVEAFQFVVCYLTRETSLRLRQLQQSGQDGFTAKNNAQAYYYRPLSMSYADCTFLSRFIELTGRSDVGESLLPVLRDLAALYAVTRLENYLPILFQGGYFGGDCVQYLHEAVELLCCRLKNEAVSLVDAIAPADFALNSVLGASDGKVYQHLEEKMKGSPAWNQRPEWWEIVLQKPPKSNL